MNAPHSKLRRWLDLTATAYLLLGAGFLTQWIFPPFGLQGWPDPGLAGAVAASFFSFRVFSQLYGVLLMGAGGLLLCFRSVSAPDAQRALVKGFAILNLTSAAATMLLQQAVLSGRSLIGWPPIVLFLALAAAFGYWLLSPSGVSPAGTAGASGATLGQLREGWLREVREAAAQQERSRLARELHDSIKQQIFSINISAATCQARLESDPAGARAALEDVRRGAHEAMTEMEAMLQQLQPAPLATVGLVEALRKQCEALQFRTGAQVTTDFAGVPAEDQLPPGTAEALFRIAQEALANVARHARASAVHVRLGLAADDRWLLQLEVRDDGPGFDPGAVPAGMGLSNMRLRAQAIGAALEVGPAEGGGTAVRVSLPLGTEEVAAAERWHLVQSVLAMGMLGMLDLALRFGSTPLFLLAFVAAGVLAFLELKRAEVRDALAERRGADSAPVLGLRSAGHARIIAAYACTFAVIAPGNRLVGLAVAAVLILRFWGQGRGLVPSVRALRRKLPAHAFRDAMRRIAGQALPLTAATVAYSALVSWPDGRLFPASFSLGSLLVLYLFLAGSYLATPAPRRVPWGAR